MSKTSITTATYTAEALANKRHGPDQIKVYIGTWYGMGGWKQPGWVTSGADEYVDLDELRAQLKQLNEGSDFTTIDPKSIKLLKITRTITTETTVEPIPL